MSMMCDLWTSKSSVLPRFTTGFFFADSHIKMFAMDSDVIKNVVDLSKVVLIQNYLS